MSILIRLITILVGATIIIAGSVTRAEAPIVDLKQAICPIGDEEFSQDVGRITYSTLILPDGSYPGDENIDARILECPSNGFVFDPEMTLSRGELVRVEEMIRSAEYVAMRSQTRHARMLWLAEQLGRTASEKFGLLEAASWAARTQLERNSLMTKAAKQGPTLIADAGFNSKQKLLAELFVVNALRELGNFAEAKSAHSNLLPNIQLFFEDHDRTRTLGRYFLIGDLIQSGNSQRRPLEILPVEWAQQICGKARTGNALDAWRPDASEEDCRRNEQRLASIAHERAQLLLAGENVLEKLCDAPSWGVMMEPLNEICLDIKKKHDLADRIVFEKNSADYVEQCEATSVEAFDKSISNICISYILDLNQQIGTLIAADDAAFRLFCEVGDTERTQGICGAADRHKQYMETQALSRDAGMLARTCANDYSQRDLATTVACFNYFNAADRQQLTELVLQSALFKSQCGYYSPYLQGNNIVISGSEYERRCRTAMLIGASFDESGTSRDPLLVAECVEALQLSITNGFNLPCKGNGADSEAVLIKLIEARARTIIKEAKERGQVILPAGLAL